MSTPVYEPSSDLTPAEKDFLHDDLDTLFELLGSVFLTDTELSRLVPRELGCDCELGKVCVYMLIWRWNHASESS
jgi:hypothetical protein